MNISNVLNHINRSLLGLGKSPTERGIPNSAEQKSSPKQQITNPVNYTLQDTNPTRILEDANYSLKIARSYIDNMPGGRDFIKGKSVVELGPGVNFGTALILVCWGAESVTVSDRFLSEFQTDYHTPVYKAIIKLLLDDNRDCDIQPIRDVVDAGGYQTSRLKCDKNALEDLATHYPDTFDITLSNAVFEHLYHPLKALNSLYLSMKHGGIGLHQVDFRDHRDFSKPLEYLLFDEFSFHEMLRERHCECGNRIRPDEMHAMFEHIGFNKVEFTPNMWADKEYQKDLLPRLRGAKFSPYADIATERLNVISGRFLIIR